MYISIHFCIWYWGGKVAPVVRMVITLVWEVPWLEACAVLDGLVLESFSPDMQPLATRESPSSRTINTEMAFFIGFTDG